MESVKSGDRVVVDLELLLEYRELYKYIAASKFSSANGDETLKLSEFFALEEEDYTALLAECQPELTRKEKLCLK